jgi:carbon monoxide dehydrogenase subunit G
VRFEERVDVPATRQEVWDFIWDVPRIAACVPGCTEARVVEPETRYAAVIEQRVGQFRARFDLDIEVLENEVPSVVVIAAKGRDGGTGSYVSAELQVSLEDRPDASTAIGLVAEVKILGKLGSLGQSMINRKTTEVVREFAASIGKVWA